MNITQIQYLLDAVSAHSIHKTAELYNISPQGASKAIQRLEDELGIPLIHRSTKGVYWTDEGEQIQEYLKEICSNYAKIKMICDEIKGIPSPEKIQGTIDLAVTPRFGDSYLGKLMSRLNQFYPGVSFRIGTMNNDKIFERVIYNKSHSTIGIVTIANWDTHSEGLAKYLEASQIRLECFFSSKLYICGTKKTLRNIGKVFPLENPGNIPVVAYEYGRGFGDSFAGYTYQMDSITAQIEMINHHGMVGAYSDKEFQLHFTEKKHGLIPFDEDISLTYGYIMKKSHVMTEVEEIFISLLKESMQEVDRIEV